MSIALMKDFSFKSVGRVTMTMPTFKRKPRHQVFTMSIEPSPPKACF